MQTHSSASVQSNRSIEEMPNAVGLNAAARNNLIYATLRVIGTNDSYCSYRSYNHQAAPRFQVCATPISLLMPEEVPIAKPGTSDGDSAPSGSASVERVFLSFDDAKSISAAIALLVTATYSSGFLIHFLFLENFGIRDNLHEFFQIKHVYIGILSMLFPAGVILPTALYLERIRERKKEASGKIPVKSNPSFDIRVYNIFVNSFLAFLFYVYVVFIPTEYFIQNAWILPTVIATLCAPWLIEHIIPRCFKSPRVANEIRIGTEGFCACLTLVGLSYFALLPISGTIQDVFLGRFICYAFFVVAIPLVITRANKRVHENDGKKNKLRIKLAATVASLMLYFCGLIAFSLYVFPFIPANRGGGNFENLRPIRIVFKSAPTSVGALAVSEKERIASSDTLILIERTTKTLFLADTKDSNPSDWARLRTFPRIVELSSDSVEIVTGQRKQ